jgi:hypothetical protein
VFWDNLPQDPNTPLHALAALDLASGTATPFHLGLLGYPDGLEVRLLAWPVLLSSLPFHFLVGPIQAFNLGVLLWLSLQGLMVGLLGARLGWNMPARLVASAAMITAPTTLRALGNGQFENLTAMAFVLGVFALLSKGRSAALWGLAAGLLAAFSSPYQGVVLGALIGVGVVLHRPRETWPALLGAGVALLLAVAYFVGVTAGQVHLSALPAPGAISEAASLSEVFLPWLYSPPHSTGELPSAGLAGATESIVALFNAPRRVEFGTHWDWVNSVAFGYTGLCLVLLGGWGIWRQRERDICKVIGVFGIASLLMAMGSTLVLSPGNNTGIPMPWAIPSMIDSIGQMQATVRFLTGLAFAAVIGLGFLCHQLGPKLSLGLGTLVVADGLLMTPAHWPVPAAAPDIEQIAQTLPAGPVASWPGPPALAPRHHQTLALILERPVSWFSGLTPESTELVETDGRKSHELEENDQGESPDQWLRRVQTFGVKNLLQFQTPESKNLGALFQPQNDPICATELCSWSLQQTPQPGPRRSPAELEK